MPPPQLSLPLLLSAQGLFPSHPIFLQTLRSPAAFCFRSGLIFLDVSTQAVTVQTYCHTVTTFEYLHCHARDDLRVGLVLEWPSDILLLGHSPHPHTPHGPYHRLCSHSSRLCPPLYSRVTLLHLVDRPCLITGHSNLSEETFLSMCSMSECLDDCHLLCAHSCECPANLCLTSICPSCLFLTRGLCKVSLYCGKSTLIDQASVMTGLYKVRSNFEGYAG